MDFINLLNKVSKPDLKPNNNAMTKSRSYLTSFVPPCTLWVFKHKGDSREFSALNTDHIPNYNMYIALSVLG